MANYRVRDALSNGWRWESGDRTAITFFTPGWTVKCKWIETESGKWVAVLTAEEVSTTPWERLKVAVWPQIGYCRYWDRPDPRVMEEISHRVGKKRVAQIIGCCRAHTVSPQMSN